MAALKFIMLPAIRQQTATVIFLHVRIPCSTYYCLSTYHTSNQGLGDKGSNEQGWKQAAYMFRRDVGLGHVKWILPDA